MDKESFIEKEVFTEKLIEQPLSEKYLLNVTETMNYFESAIEVKVISEISGHTSIKDHIRYLYKAKK